MDEVRTDTRELELEALSGLLLYSDADIARLCAPEIFESPDARELARVLCELSRLSPDMGAEHRREEAARLSKNGMLDVFLSAQARPFPTSAGTRAVALELRQRRAVQEIARRRRELAELSHLEAAERAGELAEIRDSWIGVDAVRPEWTTAVFDPLSIDEAPDEPSVLTFTGVSVLRTGGLLLLHGPRGSGKSSASEALAASPFAEGADCLGFESDAARVLYIDTERSRGDLFNASRRCARRIGSQPDGLVWRGLKMVERPEDRLAATLELVNEHRPEILIIDHVSDLTASINNETEARLFVRRLSIVAEQRALGAVCVMHPNKGAPTGAPARGWLGAEIERKAESVIELERERAAEIRKLRVVKNRGAADNAVMSFRWSELEQMHVACDTLPAQPAAVARREGIARAVFTEGDRLTWTEAQSRIQEAQRAAGRGATEGRAKSLLSELIRDGHVHDYGGLYGLPGGCNDVPF
jgi:KaiC/GvpD/RAD55 family RecA-like ATPase